MLTANVLAWLYYDYVIVLYKCSYLLLLHAGILTEKIIGCQGFSFK